MGTLDEVKKMQDQGMTESQIRTNLKGRGITTREIDDAFSQSQIKNAVEQRLAQSPSNFAQPNQSQDNSQMQASLLPPESQHPAADFNTPPGSENQNQSSNQQQMAEYQPQTPQPSQSTPGYEQTMPVGNYAPPQTGQQVQEYNPESYQGYEEYQPYQSYTSGASPEMISEVTEQLITEKLSGIRKKLEKGIDIKNTIGTKVDYLEERLKRIEKIIDTLQSSVLRKVGDYTADVQDIKTELVETQKSLSKLFPEIQDRAHKKHKTKNTHKKK